MWGNDSESMHGTRCEPWEESEQEEYTEGTDGACLLEEDMA